MPSSQPIKANLTTADAPSATQEEDECSPAPKGAPLVELDEKQHQRLPATETPSSDSAISSSRSSSSSSSSSSSTCSSSEKRTSSIDGDTREVNKSEDNIATCRDDDDEDEDEDDQDHQDDRDDQDDDDDDVKSTSTPTCTPTQLADSQPYHRQQQHQQQANHLYYGAPAGHTNAWRFYNQHQVGPQLNQAYLLHQQHQQAFYQPHNHLQRPQQPAVYTALAGQQQQQHRHIAYQHQNISQLDYPEGYFSYPSQPLHYIYRPPFVFNQNQYYSQPSLASTTRPCKEQQDDKTDESCRATKQAAESSNDKTTTTTTTSRWCCCCHSHNNNELNYSNHHIQQSNNRLAQPHYVAPVPSQAPPPAHLYHQPLMTHYYYYQQPFAQYQQPFRSQFIQPHLHHHSGLNSIEPTALLWAQPAPPTTSLAPPLEAFYYPQVVGQPHYHYNHQSQHQLNEQEEPINQHQEQQAQFKPLDQSLVSLLPIEIEPTKTRQAYGMDQVWQEEFEQLFSHFASDIVWSLVEVETNPSIVDDGTIVGYKGRYIIRVCDLDEADESLATSQGDDDCEENTDLCKETEVGDNCDPEESDCDSGAVATLSSGSSSSNHESSQIEVTTERPGSRASSPGASDGPGEDNNVKPDEAPQEPEQQSTGRKFPTKFRMFIDSAKVRFCCDSCGHGWTSMKGRVVFWYELFELVHDNDTQSSNQEDKNDNQTTAEANNSLVGYCAYKLFGQQCDICKIENRFERPMWYPEEVAKVLGNLYNKIGQVYFGFKMPAIDKQRRAGKPKTSHNSSLCQACHDGVCTDRK